MPSSLPSLLPHDPHTLWYPSLITHPPPNSDGNPINPNDPNSHHHGSHQQQQQPKPQQRTPLTILRADELALQMRKANIRRFGAGWLRPPGVGKTLQGMADERAEREEVEGARAREFALAEAQAAAEAEAEAQGILVEGEAGAEGQGEVVGERDLDEEVPDADVEEAWSDDDGGGDVIDDEIEVGGGTMLDEDGEGEGDFADGEGLEGGDLDDEVPEAEEGSYEHTDTDLEDESSQDGQEVGIGGDMRRQGGPVLGTFDRRTGEVVRVSGGAGSSGVLGSSVFGRSPVGLTEGGNRNAGRGRGRGGREN